jgi:adenylate kinase family enzyme
MFDRIVIVGTSGSGKTTLARAVATVLGLRHTELDALHWEPNWTGATRDVFRARATEATAGDRWVIDGNYTVVRDITWARADTLVWLDYPMSLVMRRVLWRTLVRGWTGVELWNGNRERLLKNFVSRDSIVLWAWTTWRKNRHRYAKLFRSPEYAGKHRVRLRSPAEADAWVARVARDRSCGLDREASS